jgi:hypothetical protein
MFGMTRLTPWGLVHHVPEFINRTKRYNKKEDTEVTAGFSLSIDEFYGNAAAANESTRAKKKRSFTLIPWFFSRKSIENNTFTSHDRNESFMRKMVAKKTIVDDDDVDKMPMETLNEMDTQGSERRLLNDKKRTSGESDMSDISITDKRQNTNIPIASPLSQPYGSSSASLPPPMLPPHYVTPPFNGNAADLDMLLRREQERSSNLEARSTELSNRVEELEVILSEYFINTAYLDQLRSRKKAKLIPDSDKDSA